MPNYEFKKNRMSDDDELKDFYYTDLGRFRRGESKTLENLRKNIRFKYVKPISKDSRFEIDADRDKLIGTYRIKF